VSKWKVPRVRKPTARVTTIALGTTMGIAAMLALPRVQTGDTDCPLFGARLETNGSPALELRFCATIPSTGAVLVRYDVAVRLAIMSPRFP
jgi:hypothetical protein